MYKKTNLFFLFCSLALVLALVAAAIWGAVQIEPQQMWLAFQHALEQKSASSIQEGVFWQIRLPRVLLCTITGSVLAVSGVLMQGLFRNPIVEPGLTGTSAGAAFGAAFVFVLGPILSPGLKSIAGPLLVPAFAFVGGLLATFFVYRLSIKNNRHSTLHLLLVGIAINGLALSGTGFLTYIARDPQARSIVFWNLGTFSGATWQQVGLTAVISTLCFILALRYAKKLNALLLGEAEAGYLGIEVAVLKRKILLVNTIMVSITTAFVGVISFMGLITPHILRAIIGSDNRKLLPAAAMAGALLLLLADLAARLLLAPAEIPIGIITSLVGAPLFIFLSRQFQR